MNTLETLEQGITTHSPEESQQWALRFAQSLPVNTTLCLHGTLGTGKTTFVQGMARAWDIAEAVTSPTYNLYTVYQGSRQLIHLDAYRLDSADAMESLNIEEWLRPPFCLAIEWPERIEEWLDARAWHLHLGIEGSSHTIRLERGK